jgi:hypothetical protein
MATLALLLAAALALPADVTAPWFDLGFALPGVNGVPALEASGPLTGGSVLAIDLTQAHPQAHAYLVVGFSKLYAPYKGGVLVPAFDLLVQIPTDDLGEIHLQSHWPHGAPSGVPLIMQFWINDPQAPQGRAGSNAVEALTP